MIIYKILNDKVGENVNNNATIKRKNIFDCLDKYRQFFEFIVKDVSLIYLYLLLYEKIFCCPIIFIF